MEIRQNSFDELSVVTVLGMMAAAGIFEGSQGPEKILR
jgi:hypothetical protein